MSSRTPELFGNNLHLVFAGHFRNGQDNELTLADRYLAQIQQSGPAWQNFVTQNPELLRRIQTAAIAHYTTTDLVRELFLIGRTQSLAAAQEFGKQNNLDEREQETITNLSAVMEEAARLMVAAGIDLSEIIPPADLLKITQGG